MANWFALIMRFVMTERESVRTCLPMDLILKFQLGLNLRSFKTTEKYGLIWTCLKDEPRQPIPDYEAFNNPGDTFKLYDLEPATWDASALRHAENFNDLAHISYDSR